MKSLRILAAVAALVLYASPISAQAVDSVTIEVLAPPSAVQIDAPARGFVGDTVVIAYALVDEDGTPTEGIATWSVSDPDGTPGAEIVSQTDSTVTVVLIRRGNATFIVEVVRPDILVLGVTLTDGGRVNGEAFAAGTFRWLNPSESNSVVLESIGATAQMCAVLVAGDAPVAVSSEGACLENLPGSPDGVRVIRSAEGPILVRPSLLGERADR